MEDYIFPRRSDKRGSLVTELPKGKDLNEKDKTYEV